MEYTPSKCIPILDPLRNHVLLATQAVRLFHVLFGHLVRNAFGYSLVALIPACTSLAYIYTLALRAERMARHSSAALP